MASRYVPPHLRNIKGSAQNEADSATAHADSNQFARRRLQDLPINSANDDAGYSLDEIATYYNNDQVGVSFKASTLHYSTNRPHELVYVLLFRDANPRWEKDQIIFAKTNIHILPGYSTFKVSIDGKSTTGQDEGATEALTSLENLSLKASEEHNQTPTHESPTKSSAEKHVPPSKVENTRPLIPIFSQQSPKSSRRFTFTGYFRILNIEFLAPHCPELIRMLEQKWALTHGRGLDSSDSRQTDTKQRNPERWAASLGHEWAVVKMERVEEEGLEEPNIGKKVEEV